MSERTLVASATNLLARGFLVVPTDRVGRDKAPVNALFAVARAIHRVMAFKTPARAVAVIDAHASENKTWPAILRQQLEPLPELLRALGLHVVVAPDEIQMVASYARAALDAGDDVIIAGVDKRYAQLVSDRLWWYDANKDVRYTPDIVKKRFNVPPEQVAEWLALVGDDDQMPGIKGIGAKGATTLLETHGSVANALGELDKVEKRLSKALSAAGDDLTRELARGRLDAPHPLPVKLAELTFVPPNIKARNELYDKLGFTELLTADGEAFAVEICESASDLEAALPKLRTSDAANPIAIHPLMEDAEPEATIAGVALSNGAASFYVPFGSPAWAVLAKTWLVDASIPKVGHNLVGTVVELRRTGTDLGGIVFDTACASHLAHPSNWAPHDLPIVAKHVLGRALPEDDAIRGVGKQRKTWKAISVGRVGEHAARYADAIVAIAQKLAPTTDRDQLAEYLELSSTLVRMELTGLLVDPKELADAEAAFAVIEAELQKEIDDLAGHTFNINSSKQLGTVLFEELKLPIVSHTKTGWSTSIEALERIENAHPIVSLVLRWRRLRRLRDSWLIALRKCIHSDGRVHSRFHPARSFSGQLVNTNPDLGRVPGRTPEMARVRRAFVAAPGHLLMSVDFNQLGLHVLAHLTKDPALTTPLRERADMHVLTAAAVLEKEPAKITTEERQLGKVVNFATFAGQGASALALQLNISAQQAKEYIARFDRHYAKVRAFQDEQLRLARERGYITTIAGRRWTIGGLESLDSQDRSYAERMARRAPHEGSVSDVSRRALLEADRALRKEKLRTVPVLQVLDEVLFDVPEDELEQAARLCSHAMRHAFELEVPLAVGVEAGKNWADLEPVVV